jgi:hypothetical protein
MSAQDLLARLVGALKQAGIPYMFTGSLASSVHGMPRASNDFDIVIAPAPEQLRILKTLLPESQYYFDLDDALETLKRKAQFNVIDLNSGWKIDFIIRKSRAFSNAEFDRRFEMEVEGLSLFMASAEDVIVAKLEWAKISASQRQIEDAAGILRIRFNDLDWNYIGGWVQELGLQGEWQKALQVAGLQEGQLGQ